MVTVKDRISYLRGLVDPPLTHAEIARAGHISQGAVAQASTGVRFLPAPGTLRGISRALGCSWAWLGYGDGRQPTQSVVRRAVAAWRVGA